MCSKDRVPMLPEIAAVSGVQDSVVSLAQVRTQAFLMRIIVARDELLAERRPFSRLEVIRRSGVPHRFGYACELLQSSTTPPAPINRRRFPRPRQRIFAALEAWLKLRRPFSREQLTKTAGCTYYTMRMHSDIWSGAKGTRSPQGKSGHDELRNNNHKKIQDAIRTLALAERSFRLREVWETAGVSQPTFRKHKDLVLAAKRAQAAIVSAARARAANIGAAAE